MGMLKAATSPTPHPDHPPHKGRRKSGRQFDALPIGVKVMAKPIARVGDREGAVLLRCLH